MSDRCAGDQTSVEVREVPASLFPPQVFPKMDGIALVVVPAIFLEALSRVLIKAKHGPTWNQVFVGRSVVCSTVSSRAA